MRIVAVMNYKGGVGKTTVTANLAAGLALKGLKVLLMDMDAQASLTFSFIAPDIWKGNVENTKTIRNWFESIKNGSNLISLRDVVIKPHKVNSRIGRKGCIDLTSSHLELIDIDLELATLL